MADDDVKALETLYNNVDAAARRKFISDKKSSEEYKTQVDLSKQLVDQLKKIEGMYKNNEISFSKMSDISKRVFLDTKARGLIQNQMSSDIEDSQKEIIKKRLAGLAEEAAEMKNIIELKKAQDKLSKDGKIGREFNSVTEAVVSAEKSLGDIQKKHDDIIKKAEDELKVNQDLLKNKRLQAGFMAHMEDSNYAALGPFSDIVLKSKQFRENIKVIPLRFILLNTLIKAGIDRFVALDKAAEDFRKKTGFSNTQMVELRKNAESINREFQDTGVGITEVYASAKALTDVFGRTSLVSREAMQNISLMSVNLGVAAEDSANVLATFQGLGKVSQEVAMNVMKVGAGFSEKAGIPFSLVMKDIANASEQTTALLGANPSKLMKSAIAARALGTDLNKIVSSQRKLLDFSSSINEELEASALLGRSISFQKARQLAYDGDIEGAAKATLDSVKAAGDFNAMNVYQREALAKASGMELKDLTKMMAVEAQRQEIELRGTDEQKAKLDMQTKALAKLKEENDLSKEGLLAEGDRAIRQQKMQGQMTQLKNIMESLMVSIGDVLEPIVRVASFILVPVFNIVAALIRGMLKPILNIGQALMGNTEKAQKFAVFAEKVSTAMIGVYDSFEKTGEIISKILIPISGIFGLIEKLTGSAGRFSRITINIAASFLRGARYVDTFASGLVGIFRVFKPVASMIGSVLKGFSFFAKFLGPIGLIITAVQVVVDLVGQFVDIWSSDDMDFGEKILKSFVAIPKALYNVLVQPFIDMAAWLLNWMWPGVGDSMLKGIKSVGDDLFRWLKSPFQAAFGWFKNDSGMAGQSPSEIGLMILDGIKSVGGMLLDVIISPFKTGFEFVTSAFSYVVNSIKNVASDIFGFITSPFKKAMEFVKSIPLFGKLFGGNDIGAAAKPQVDNSTIENSSIIEVKNLDALRDVVQELTNAVANLATAAPAAAGATATMNTSGIEAKLDTLTNLLTGGAVRVYLDGKDVSSAMSGMGR